MINKRFYNDDKYDLWVNPVSQNENVFTKKVNGKTVTITDEQGIL
ncbi:hypothetical protein [Butyrivibrio sp. MC2021]|nr:hypothetical protein [Butyrivibrio sp. MC2021]